LGICIIKNTINREAISETLRFWAKRSTIQKLQYIICNFWRDRKDFRRDKENL